MFRGKPILIILVLILLLIFGLFALFIYQRYNQSNNLAIVNNDMAKQQKIIRPAAVAGSFYPADKAELQEMVNGFLSQVLTATSMPKILIVPHAGYPYSGQVAAYSFKQLAGQNIKTAIIIGPSHHFPLAGLALSSATVWQTPLGEVKVSEVNKDLVKEPGFAIADEVHAPEHAIEIELPFLQSINPDIFIVPIIVGQLSSSQQSSFAEVLAKYLDDQTILIVSVDMSHYHPYNQAVALDKKSIDDILKLNSSGVLGDEIDAPWAVASVLQLAKTLGLQPRLLKYANSGDVTGDKSAVVGYSAIGFYSKKQESNKTIKQDEYSAAEKKELLGVARTTIEQYLKTGKIYQPTTDNPKFKEKRGVFVTLNKNGQLRGCIGYIEPIKSLIEAVRDNAIAAAADDPRFSPVQLSELKDIDIEISILTVPAADTKENIAKNKLGVVLRQGNYAATYLPQVWEGFSSPDQFFSSLCVKAGLISNCWQDKKTQFFSYQAIVFGENL